MLDGARVLIVEDKALIALDLADTVESAGAVVIGPATSNRQALGLIDAGPVEAAILDVNLSAGEVTPVLDRLVAQGTPVLIYSGRGRRTRCGASHPALSVLRKPEPPERIVSALAALMRR